MNEPFLCDKCKDTRHVLQDGSWIRCSCLVEISKGMKYARAGITFDTASLIYNLDVIKSKFPGFNMTGRSDELIRGIASSFNKKAPVTRVHCFMGSPTSAKDFILQTLLKKAVDCGYRVSSLSLDSLINKHFQASHEDEGCGITMADEFDKTDVLSLYFGSEIQFRVGENYITEMIRAYHLNCTKKVLLLDTSLTYGGLETKYNTSFQKMFVDSTMSLGDEEKRVVLHQID